MPRNKNARSLLTIRGVNGTLRWKGHQIRASWSIRVDAYGTTTIKFRPIRLTNDTAWLLQMTRATGRFVTWAKISGADSEGRRVTSEHVFIGSTGWRGTFVRIEAESSLTRVEWLPVPKTSRGLRVRYVTSGMKGFGVQTARTRSGELHLAGSAEIADYSRLAGRIDITSPPTRRDLRRWMASCDDVVDRVLRWISLAEGRAIGWSIRHLIRGDNRIIVTEIYRPTRSSDPHDGVGHFLDLQPWIDMAVKRGASTVEKNAGLDVAIHWFLFHPTYLEFQLLAATTALEHLVSRFEKAHGGAKVGNPRTFRALRNALEPFFQRTTRNGRATSRSRELLLTKMKTAISRSNDAPYVQRLLRMLKGYEVSIDGLESHIRAAISSRNLVVHSGRFREGDDAHGTLHLHVQVLRELLKRVFLTLIGYTGYYESMLNGPHRMPFPPTATTAIARDGTLAAQQDDA